MEREMGRIGERDKLQHGCQKRGREQREEGGEEEEEEE